MKVAYDNILSVGASDKLENNIAMCGDLSQTEAATPSNGLPHTSV